MATKNDITGDIIASRHSKAYADNYDAIFRKDHNNYLLHDPIDGFNTTSTLEDKENGSKERPKEPR